MNYSGIFRDGIYNHDWSFIFLNTRYFIFSIIITLVFISCNVKSEQAYIFFLHNRFLEEHDFDDLHPDYGRTEYLEIISEFEENGFTVISEKRDSNVNARVYAQHTARQIIGLLLEGVKPQNITVVGTSKGGYIAQYVSTMLENPALNYVFIASYRDLDIENIPEINYCGNILTIYDKSDPYGVSAIARKDSSTCSITHFKEIELSTDMGHGFIFKALPQWMEPTIKWAHGDYQ